MPTCMRGLGGHLRRPHGLLQKEQALGKAPWHSILPKPVPPSKRNSSPQRTVGRWGPQKGCGHPHPFLGHGPGPGHRCGSGTHIPPGTDNTSIPAAATILSNRCLRKDTKYAERCSAAGFAFRPLVQSTWGAFAPSCQDTWMDLVRRMAAHRGGPARSLLVEEFHQGLSHALMRGVGNSYGPC